MCRESYAASCSVDDAVHAGQLSLGRNPLQTSCLVTPGWHCSKEERGILRAEVILIFNGLEEWEEDMKERVEELQAVEAGSDGTGWARVLAQGEALMLTMELGRLQGIHKQARLLLTKYMPDV